MSARGQHFSVMCWKGAWSRIRLNVALETPQMFSLHKYFLSSLCFFRINFQQILKTTRLPFKYTHIRRPHTQVWDQGTQSPTGKNQSMWCFASSGVTFGTLYVLDETVFEFCHLQALSTYSPLERQQLDGGMSSVRRCGGLILSLQGKSTSMVLRAVDEIAVFTAKTGFVDKDFGEVHFCLFLCVFVCFCVFLRVSLCFCEFVICNTNTWWFQSWCNQVEKPPCFIINK